MILLACVCTACSADGGGGQGGVTVFQAADLFLPADVSASGYYIPNAYNSFIGNAASGGWAGFAFPNVPGTLGLFKVRGNHCYLQ